MLLRHQGPAQQANNERRRAVIHCLLDCHRVSLVVGPNHQTSCWAVKEDHAVLNTVYLALAQMLLQGLSLALK